MSHSIEPRDQVYAKGYGFLPFAKIMGNNLHSKYGKNFLTPLKKQQPMPLRLPQRGRSKKQ